MVEIEIDGFAALLFDLDGTLIDTMALHYAAYRDVLATRGLALSQDDYMACVGGPAREAIPKFVAAAGGTAGDAEEILAIHREKKARFAAALAPGSVVPLRAAALLDAAHGRVPVALVTSGNRDGATALLAAMGWSARFAAVVTGDEVTHGKPHPEPYLAAAAALGVDPARCLALEDTDDGLASARAGGMTALDVREPWTFR